MITLKDFQERRAREFWETFSALKILLEEITIDSALGKTNHALILENFLSSHDAELIEIVRFNEKIVGRKGWNNCLDTVLQSLKNNKE